MATRNLRVVAESDKPTPRGRTETTPRRSSKPGAKSLKAAADQSSRALLLKMRNMILAQIKDPKLPSHTLAPLARRLMELDKELRAVDVKAALESEDYDKVKAAERASRKLLVGIKDVILTQIDAGVPAHTLSPLSRRIIELDKEISALDTRAEQVAQSESAADDDAWNLDEI